MESKLYTVSEKIRQNKNREILQEHINKLAEKLDNPKEYMNILREITLQEKSINMNELMGKIEQNTQVINQDIHKQIIDYLVINRK